MDDIKTTLKEINYGYGAQWIRDFFWENFPRDWMVPISKNWEQFVKQIIDDFFPGTTEFFDNWMAENQSFHARDFPLMNPYDVLLIAILYVVGIFLLIIVTYPLPKLSLKLPALIHNIFLSALSFYMCTEVIRQAFFVHDMKIAGNPYIGNSEYQGMANIHWLFYVSKVYEFLDTVIMVLKKNYRQVTFLHMYHHFSVFSIWWLVVFMAPGAEAWSSVALNSWVHVVMYGYYAFALLGFSFVKVIKRYITAMQMTQFVLLMSHSAYNVIVDNKEYPWLTTRLLFFYMISLLILFANFLIQDIRRAKAEKNAKNQNQKKKNK